MLSSQKAYNSTVLLWADPDMSITPFAKFSEFLHFRMVVLDIILNRKAARVVDPDIAT